MKKYYKKEYVEAEQYLPPEQIPEGVTFAVHGPYSPYAGQNVASFGPYMILPGDYVVIDSYGGKQVMTQKAFEHNYSEAPVESFAPGVVINGIHYTPTGKEWLVAFAMAGCQWAIEALVREKPLDAEEEREQHNAKLL